MRKSEVIGIGLVVVLVVSAAAYFVIPALLTKPSPSVCTGGIYRAQASSLNSEEIGAPLYNLTYTQNGVQQSGLYYSYSSSALSWIKINTASNSTFLNWWDYGKEIIGCTGRSSVISNPSAQLIALGFTKNVTERDSNQSLTDVATALFTTNLTLSQSIISKYGAGYVLVTTEDGGNKAPFILQLLGLNSADYLTSSSATFNPADWTSIGQQTLIYKLFAGQSVAGLTQVYSDAYVKIFKVG
jgi:asparagine N-glycosylation enzyme membrane subunit Stt3